MMCADARMRGDGPSVHRRSLRNPHGSAGVFRAGGIEVIFHEEKTSAAPMSPWASMDLVGESCALRRSSAWTNEVNAW
ncbi:hypothetical protein X976_5153 [Burkholderia pseudomallei MSHR7500]|nr:hypothetical protein X976_5153 [Burkholderia pseudomallei MSHR7500]